MIVLGLDTTGAHCSACLINDQTVLAHSSEKIGRGHAERLAPMVADLFKAATISPDQIDRVAVCVGPGSFTGLRVALSFAKGFALPRGLPIVGLDALAVTFLMQGSSSERAIIYQDVKRGQIISQTYEVDKPLPTSGPDLGTMEELRRKAAAMTLPLIEADVVDVRVMAKAAAALDAADYPADPLYARPPDAKLPGGLTPSPA